MQQWLFEKANVRAAQQQNAEASKKHAPAMPWVLINDYYQVGSPEHYSVRAKIGQLYAK